MSAQPRPVRCGMLHCGCGGEDFPYTRTYDGESFVRCSACRAHSGKRATSAEAIAAWNRMQAAEAMEKALAYTEDVERGMAAPPDEPVALGDEPDWLGACERAKEMRRAALALARGEVSDAD